MNLEVGKVYTNKGGNTLLLAKVGQENSILVPVAKITGEILLPEDAMEFCITGPSKHVPILLKDFTDETRPEVIEAAKIYMTEEYQERFDDVF